MTSRTLFIHLAWLVCGGAAAPLLAQTTPPSREQMIEQLRPAPLTRSLRNLSVEAAPAPGAQPSVEAPQAQGLSPVATTVARPSLSLLIQFDFNSARIKAESQPALAHLAQALQSTELAGFRFAVEGHTDAKGGADYNLKLSQARAQAVQEFLRIQGVTSGRLVATGKGATELANPGDPLAAENRRVRIVNLD